eukprot:gb/GECG01006483.1/.p1 GENE.gb/GECG01006483.1/~~gb/GECG01006483.1/.p1  ORF type:complete len:635 (+),score=96.05 gb/GECG01006483.1/:1-1905(+)
MQGKERSQRPRLDESSGSLHDSTYQSSSHLDKETSKTDVGLSSPVRQYQTGQPPLSRRVRKKMQQQRSQQSQHLSSTDKQSAQIRAMLLEDEAGGGGNEQGWRSYYEGSQTNNYPLEEEGGKHADSQSKNAVHVSSPAVKASAQRMANRRMSGALEVRPVSTKMQHCIDILVTGHVEAFIDFFYLTHRLGDTDQSKMAQAPHRGLQRDKHHKEGESHADPSFDEMSFLQKHLCDIERATRKGNKDTAIDCHFVLSDHFRESHEYTTSAYFLERCLEYVRVNADVKTEMRTAQELGKIHEAMDEHETATDYHELHRKLAEEEGDRYEIRLSNQQLIRTYSKRAELIEERADDSERERLARVTRERPSSSASTGSEANRPTSRASSHFDDSVGDGESRGSRRSAADGSMAEALDLYLKAFEAAQNAGDREAEGKASYAVGKVYINQGDPDKAIFYLRGYLSIAKSMQGEEGMEAQGEAYGALAAAYQKIGGEYADKAMECLKEFLRVAEGTNNLGAQADACINLGTVASKNNELDDAVHYFERAYQLRQRHSGYSEDNRKATERARMLLGMAKGNAKMGAYVNVVKSDLTSLLRWKVKRSDHLRGSKNRDSSTNRDRAGDRFAGFDDNDAIDARGS